MTDPLSENPTPSPLQFDQVEGEAAAATLTCQLCRQTLQDQYYEINGHLACPPCKDKAEAGRKSGSPAKRFIKAFAAGSVAAAVGCGLYYAVVKFTGYEIGLIAILVGFLVGAAVRWGSEGRGGWGYQALAIFLTYNAIVLTYLPFIFDAIKDKKAASSTPVTQVGSLTPTVASQTPPVPPATIVPTVSSVAVTPVANLASATAETTVLSSATTLAPSPTSPAAEVEKITFLKFVLGVGAIFLLAYMAPFLAGFQNAIGWFIIGFALYQAWKMNLKPSWNVTGPYKAGPPPPSTGT